MARGYYKSNRAWGFGFGASLIALVMTAVFTTEAVSGCAGDCMTCHPKLEDSKEHQSLKTCITCHVPNKIKFKLEVTAIDGCGERCFVCHKEFPKDAYHAPLGTCLTCHAK